MVQITQSAVQNGCVGGGAVSRTSSEPSSSFRRHFLAVIQALRGHPALNFAIACALIATGGIGFIYRDFHRTLQAAEQRLAGTTKIAHTTCGPIQYADFGQGPAVLLVHGAGGGSDQGQDLAQALVQRGYRVIAMSRFGYLGTPMPADASPAAQAEAHACLLETLGIPQATVIAASAGTPSALQLAIRHADRVKSLILMAPATYVPRPDGAPSLNVPRSTQRLLNAAVRSDFLFWAATRLAQPLLIKSLLATPPEMLEAVEETERQRAAQVLDMVLPISARRAGLMNDLGIVTSLTRFDLEKIKAPTLIFSAADDSFGTYEAAQYTARNIDGARFVGFKDGGHLAVGHEKEILAEIVGFLK